ISARSGFARDRPGEAAPQTDEVYQLLSVSSRPPVCLHRRASGERNLWRNTGNVAPRAADPYNSPQMSKNAEEKLGPIRRYLRAQFLGHAVEDEYHADS